jgi:hypothetical protein
MIRIAITAPAFEAIKAALPLDSVAYEPQRTAEGDFSSGSSVAGSTSWRRCDSQARA